MNYIEELLNNINQEYPSLVVELSGPWHDGSWICNFKDKDNFLTQVHSGSSGWALEEAIKNGHKWLKENYKD